MDLRAALVVTDSLAKLKRQQRGKAGREEGEDFSLDYQKKFGFSGGRNGP